MILTIAFLLGSIVVFGGLFICIGLIYSFHEVKRILHGVTVFHKENPYDRESLVSRLVTIATFARKEGVLALESFLSDDDDPFLREGLMYTIDGVEEKFLNDILQLKLNSLEDCNKRKYLFFEHCGKTVLGMGIIAALVNGIFLCWFDAATVDLSIKMMVILLGPLYGFLTAFFIFFPIAHRLQFRSTEEIQYKRMITEGCKSIYHGHHPRLLEEVLCVFTNKQM